MGQGLSVSCGVVTVCCVVNVCLYDLLYCFHRLVVLSFYCLFISLVVLLLAYDNLFCIIYCTFFLSLSPVLYLLCCVESTTDLFVVLCCHCLLFVPFAYSQSYLYRLIFAFLELLSPFVVLYLIFVYSLRCVAYTIHSFVLV